MNSVQSIAAHITQLLQSGETHAACLRIINCQGSAPRDTGCTMFVSRLSLKGTIGGGHLEYTLIQSTRENLAARLCRTGHEKRVFSLGPSLGQCCGGKVEVQIETFELSKMLENAPALQEAIFPNSFQIAVFGAGHVGQALISILGTLPCTTTWIDSREEMFPKHLPGNVSTLYSEEPQYEVATFPRNICYVIMTHSHPLDEKILEAILKRNDSAYCGLIGSKSKRIKFEKRLSARGLPMEYLQKLTCPIGDTTINGKHPGEIAVALASQLLQLNPVSANNNITNNLSTADMS
ncbi:MAG: xanthine dehydrogenase accessory protein XdhC [Pseudomonadales bacterium]|nr:xanthine dehydrogenase accessory protein XdhC [Pseudomonadales bacterium]